LCRQQLIRDYEALAGARLIVRIDAIFEVGTTLLEELLVGSQPERPLHVLLASPGGDGEVAIRLVKLLQSSCSELTIIVPDMAKSAATLMCLGADVLLMGAASDLGPVNPQFPLRERGGLVSAREIQRAVEDAERVGARDSAQSMTCSFVRGRWPGMVRW
jgi:membrane-bound ClpP family serine protease